MIKMNSGEIETSFKVMEYRIGQIPFESLIRSNFFYCSIWSPMFYGNSEMIGPAYLKNRCNYMLEVCDCLALIDNIDEELVYSYVLYRRQEDKMVIYLSYTKKNFRQIGLMSKLINHLIKDQKEVRVSYTGKVPVYLLNKGLIFERGGV